MTTAKKQSLLSRLSESAGSLFNMYSHYDTISDLAGGSGVATATKTVTQKGIGALKAFMSNKEDVAFIVILNRLTDNDRKLVYKIEEELFFTNYTGPGSSRTKIFGRQQQTTFRTYVCNQKFSPETKEKAGQRITTSEKNDKKIVERKDIMRRNSPSIDEQVGCLHSLLEIYRPRKNDIDAVVSYMRQNRIPGTDLYKRHTDYQQQSTLVPKTSQKGVYITFFILIALIIYAAL